MTTNDENKLKDRDGNHLFTIDYMPTTINGENLEIWRYSTHCHQIVFRQTPRGIFLRADHFFALQPTDILINLWIDGHKVYGEDRDVPMETKDKGGWEKCLNCGSDVTQWDGECRRVPNFCPTCGQRLKNWNDDYTG